jgi:hypothetical protein
MFIVSFIWNSENNNSWIELLEAGAASNKRNYI